MILVKIDRSTIKENPRAGETSTTALGSSTISFVIHGSLPTEFKRSDVIMLTSWIENEHYEGILLNHELFDEYKKIPGDIEWNICNEFIHYNHFPEPSHFYEYENPVIKCMECNAEIRLLAALQYDDEGYDVIICSNCHSIEPFGEIEYEKLSSVLNEIKNPSL